MRMRICSPGCQAQGPTIGYGRVTESLIGAGSGGGTVYGINTIQSNATGTTFTAVTNADNFRTPDMAQDLRRNLLTFAFNMRHN